MTFRDQFRDFQELAREHDLLRKHNQAIKPGDPQDKLLLFAEGALVIIMLERFLRMLPGVKATDDDMLWKLLKKAVDNKVLVISDQHRKGMLDIRNTVLHGNFEQAAKQAKCSTKEEYFKTQFAAEIEGFYQVANGLVDQIDPATGERKTPIAKD